MKLEKKHEFTETIRLVTKQGLNHGFLQNLFLRENHLFSVIWEKLNE